MIKELTKLKTEMEVYCKAAGITKTVLSRRAAGASGFYDRISNGGDCTFGLALRVRDYIAANPVK